MSKIDLLIHCPNGHSELLADDITSAEFMVEELSSMALTTLFETIWVDDVTITFPKKRGDALSIALRAQGFEPLVQVQNMDCAIEEKVTCALAELFDTINVEHCAML